MEHRNSTPAIHLKMEDRDYDNSLQSMDSLTSISPQTRSRHPTWSHYQHQVDSYLYFFHLTRSQKNYLFNQEHKRKLSQFRVRAASVSKSTQTNDDQESKFEPKTDGVVGENSANVQDAKDDYDGLHLNLYNTAEETTCF